MCFYCNYSRTHAGADYYEDQQRKQQEYNKKQQERIIQKLSTPTDRDKRKAIKQVSTKRQKQLSEYSKERIKFLTVHQGCQANLSGCTGLASEIHHQQGKENELLLDQDKWLAICRSCHSYITENSNWAICVGLSLRRNGINAIE